MNGPDLRTMNVAWALNEGRPLPLDQIPEGEREQVIKAAQEVVNEWKTTGGLLQVSLDDLESSASNQQFVIEQYLPRREVTLLASHGGTGKTLWAIAAAVHVACGKEFCGKKTGPGSALFLSLEDEGQLQIKPRTRKIAHAFKLDIQAIKQNVVLIDGSEGDSVLVEEEFSEITRTRRLGATATMKQLEDLCDKHKPDLLIIDNASDAYGGDENQRRSVRTFIKMLGCLARRLNAAVLLLAHIDKAAARFGSAGNSYSGSTAWHNSVRSRLALLAEGELVKLVHEKWSRTKKSDDVYFRWDENGILIPTQRTPEDELAFDGAEVMRAMRQAWSAGESVPAARSGPRTAAKILPQYGLELSKGRLWKAIEHLQASGELVSGETQDSRGRLKQQWIAPDS